MKKKHAIKRRIRIEGRISELALNAPDDAMELAQQGRIRSYVELTVHCYIRSQEHLVWLQKLSGASYLNWCKELGVTPDYRQAVARAARESEVAFCRMFLDAFDKGDKKTLQGIICAKMTYRADPANTPAHQVRARILELKRIGLEGLKWIQVARFVYPPSDRENDRTWRARLDCYEKTIRRACHDLHYRLADRGRPKKLDK